MLYMSELTHSYVFQVLDCFTIPTVLFCSSCFLKVKYKCLHFTGVFVCLAGVSLLILADVLVDRHTNEGAHIVTLVQ